MSPPAQPSPPKSRPSAPDGLSARRAALALVEAALARRGGMEDADEDDLDGLDPRDRGFARALARTSLRWKGAVDRALAAKLHKPPPEPAMALLRLGATQMLAMGTPAHAAVSTTMALAQASPSTRPFAKLINAVLRGLDRERPAFTPQDFAPDWLYARWCAAYGEAAADAIAAQIAVEPPTDLSLKEPVDTAALAEALEAEVLPGGSLRTSRRGDVSTWPGFDEGRWWVQDAAAAIPARLLGVKPGQTTLDLCAAPGGKTLQLAAAGASVTALDRSAARLKRVRENLARLGLTAETVTADALAWTAPHPFDAVLLDAPCSATGTFRRHPDVLWTSRPGDIAALAQTQARMLDAAATQVKPGGRLTYCVCSLEPEEGEAQIAPFLARRPEMRLDPIGEGEGGAPAVALRPDGVLRLLPSMSPPIGGLDGFFVARFVRT